MNTSSKAVVRKFVLLLLPIAALLGVPTSPPLLAQGSQGTIQGGVFDTTGGSIANATVTVTDVARGTTRTMTTDVAGKFVAPNLTPGTYTVRAQAAGFRTVERSNVLLQVGQNVRVDLTLAPGEQTQTITVTEEAPAIDTTSATLGGTVSNEAIVQLPLNGRNFFRLLSLRPGVVARVGASSAASSSNGRRLGSDVLLVEGITQFDMATSNNLINGAGKGNFADASSLLPLDAIQEFNTQQDPQAEYGWRDGSVINVGVKSGTNSLHGSAYAFGRDTAFTDAPTYFGVSNNATMEQFGASAGGPLVKDKLFWFLAYEGLRIKTTDTSESIVPLSVTNPGGANANLSMYDACIQVGRANVNPLSAQLAGLADPNSCVISPASSSVQNQFFYNDGTQPGVDPNDPTSYHFLPGQTRPLNNGLAKVDWNITDRHHVSGFFYDSQSSPFDQGTLKPYWGTVSNGKTLEIAGAWTWVPSSTWVNDVRAGYAGTTGEVVIGDINAIPADPYGLTDGVPTGYNFNTGSSYGGFPVIQLSKTDFAPLGVGGRTGRRGPQGQFNFKDTVSYLRGNHSFKFGFEMVRVKFDDASTQNTFGTIDFNNLVSFLEGSPNAGKSSIVYGNINESFRSKWFAGFVQDTWRITPRVTVTPGLRYEYQGPPHSTDNFLGVFDPSAPGGVVQVGPGLPHSRLYDPEKADFSPRFGVAWDIMGNGKTVLRGAVSRMSSFPSITSIALSTPFGATLYDAAGNIVVDRRGTAAEGGFYNTLTNATLDWSQAGPVFPIGSAHPSCGDGIVVPAGFTDPIPQCSTGALDPNYKRPKTVQWNLDLQRAITNRLSIDIAYAGNHGYDETYSADINRAPVGTGYTAAVITTCLNTALTTSSKTIAKNCAVDQGAIDMARLYHTAFPYYNYMNRTTTGFRSNYNGLQVTVDQRDFHGLSFLASYTYSHGLDMWTKSSANTQQVADPTNNFGAQYASSDQDIRHRFRFSPTYDLPGISTPGQMLEGWRISAVVALQGRFPWSVVDKKSTDWLGTGEAFNSYSPSPNDGVQQFWNYSGPGDAFNTGKYGDVGAISAVPCYGAFKGCTSLSSAPAAIVSVCQGAAQAPYQGNPQLMDLALHALYANACYIQNGGVLTPPAYGTNGNSGRNSFRGPQFRNVDFTVSKTWHITERYSAELRTEVYNLFNSPTLDIPSHNGVDPTRGNLGRISGTADGNNNIFGSGGPRHLQFGLKLTF